MWDLGLVGGYQRDSRWNGSDGECSELERVRVAGLEDTIVIRGKTRNNAELQKDGGCVIFNECKKEKR